MKGYRDGNVRVGRLDKEFGMGAGRSIWLSMAMLSVVAAISSGDGSMDHKRDLMVGRDLRGRGITNEAVLQVMGEVPRHRFVPATEREFAYGDHPLPIGHEQTISQPYIVAAMTELIQPRPEHRVLEIGTGSGYQAAVLSRLVKSVYTIEIIPALGRTAAELLSTEGYTNVEVRVGDGYAGWPENAPFDGIIVTCGAEQIPAPLLEQLKPGGIMVIPVGASYHVQELTVIRKDNAGRISTDRVMPVRFVPMTGRMENVNGENQ